MSKRLALRQMVTPRHLIGLAGGLVLCTLVFWIAFEMALNGGVRSAG